MAEASLRAARPVRKGGLPNLLFAVASAERPPVELCGRVDEVTVLCPWGSLLRGTLAIDPVAAAGIAGLLAPDGVVRALVSVTDRDAAATDLRPLAFGDGDDIGRRWAAFGLALTRFEPAPDDEIAASSGFRLDLAQSGDFVAQTNFVQCVGASMQMMLNIAGTQDDRTAATQRRLQGLARTLSGPARAGFERKGASVRGWSAGLNQLG